MQRMTGWKNIAQDRRWMVRRVGLPPPLIMAQGEMSDRGRGDCAWWSRRSSSRREGVATARDGLR